jgi:hypothetical protein
VTLPQTCPSSMPSPLTSMLRFSSSLHTATFALCQIPDNLVQMLELPLLKRLSLVEIDISDVSLQSIIHSSYPALEWLLLVCNNLDHCIRIKSSNLESITILCQNGELIIDDAPSLRRLIHDIQSRHLQITVISASKLEALGAFYEGSPGSKIAFGSTVIQVPTSHNTLSCIHSSTSVH